GGMIVMDETSCMVDVAQFFMDFCMSESCGKCVPCRVGTKQMLGVLKRIVNGEGTDQDIDQLKRLAEMVKSTSLCGLGQTAPNPTLTTLRYFMDEYIAHIEKQECPSGVCMKKAKAAEVGA
ncbi:MAG TPA: NADH-ubiquinone oxidoreductase-F iron-sulfur binding region domain-containing protein, partial [Candidatus Acidoferrales bacterium]|nr:NADH-ubiquinone oxidoreductase-F iron-sulfur binding region domain-containing protein [Candidatus Acidoferrales bacterium]